MIMEDMLSAIKLAWQIAPFPFLFLVIIAAGFAWLWVEFQATRLLRATPGWRRPAPLMPEVSLVSVGIIRILWILLWLWLALFIVLAISLGLARNNADIPRPVVDGALSVGRAWHGGYLLLSDRLPESAPAWLRPGPLEAADLSSMAPSLEISGIRALTRSSTAQQSTTSTRISPGVQSIKATLTPTPTPAPEMLARITRNANVRTGPATSNSSLETAQ